MRGKTAAIALFTLAFLFLGCATPKAPGPLSLPEKGKRQERRLEAGPGSKIGETPQTAEAYEHLGDTNLSRNDAANALMNYERALQMEPDRSSVLYKKGRLFLTKGMTDEARGEFGNMLQKQPEHALANEGMGRAYLLDGDIKKAIEYLTKSSEKNNNLWEVRNLLGIACDRQRNFPSAIEHYKAAIAIRPSEGSLYNNLGVSYFMNEDFDKAKDAFAAAIERKEEGSKVYNNLALTFGKLGKYQEAHQSLVKAGSDAVAQNNIGYLYLLAGKNREAVDSFEKALELNPAFYVKAHDNLRTAKESLKE